MIFGIILIIISIGIVIIIAIHDKSDNIGISWFLGVLFGFGMMLFIISLVEDRPIKKSLKDNTFEIEIQQEIINGEEISRDTVYIFTPKN